MKPLSNEEITGHLVRLNAQVGALEAATSAIISLHADRAALGAQLRREIDAILEDTLWKTVPEEVRQALERCRDYLLSAPEPGQSRSGHQEV